MTPYRLLTIAAVIIILGFVFISPDPELVTSASSVSPEHPQKLTVRTGQGKVRAAIEMHNELPEQLQNSSLKGTSIDGLYPVDTDGNLILDDDIKHRFEYFLSLMGEFPLEEILSMVRDDIMLNLQEPARGQALKLFDDYIQYKRNLVALEQQLEAPAEYEVDDIQRLRWQLQKLRDLRGQYLGAEAADAFFGFDDIYDDYMLTRIEITNNHQLSEAEKAEQLSALEQQLPLELNDMRDETARISRAFHQVEEMKQQGADAQTVFDYNSQTFGQEAALRLQKLDEQRMQWQNRIDNYLQEKAEIENDEQLSAEEKTSALQTLKQASFNATEQKRLAAYE